MAVRRSISAIVRRSTAGTMKTWVTPYPASISASTRAPVVFSLGFGATASLGAAAPSAVLSMIITSQRLRRPRTSLDRQRVGRRADRAGDRDRGSDEQELVDFILGAVLGEVGQVEDLAHGQAHDRDGDPVPRLIDTGLGLVGPHFAAPGIARERGDLVAINPFQRLEGESRRVAARIAVPASSLELRLHLPGPHHDEIAALDLHSA